MRSVALALLVIACGGSGSGAGGGAGGTSAGGSGGVSAGGGGAAGAGASSGGASSGGASSGGSSSGGTSAGGSGGAGAGGSGGSPTSKGGTLSIFQTVTVIGGASYPAYSFTAGFADATSSGAGGSCTQTEQGACKVSECTSPVTTPDAGTPPPMASAGDITLAGALEALTLTPAADGSYAPKAANKLLWNEGGKLTLSASGAKVPAFSVSLDAAGVVSVKSPVIVAGTPLVVDRKLPFAVSWAGSNTGKVTVSLVRAEQASGTTHSVSIWCTYPASQGSASVPAALLGKIPAGANGSVTIYGGDTAQVVAGDWTVYATEISGSTSAIATYQ